MIEPSAQLFDDFNSTSPAPSHQKVNRGDQVMFGILKLKLIEAVRGLQHACATAVSRDDDGDDGDIATPKTYFNDEA